MFFKLKIERYVYYDGNFQSLGFIANGEGKSVTVIDSGVYNFREEKHEVVIVVVVGEILLINFNKIHLRPNYFSKSGYTNLRFFKIMSVASVNDPLMVAPAAAM